jgi:RimJ/RimL family protein N-acetyltransferase
MKYVLDGEETQRLKFRLLNDQDFEEWIDLFKEENVASFLGLPTELSPKELCQKWFDKVNHRYENNLGGMNVLVDKTTNKMVGQCGLLIQTVQGKTRMEVGYSILPKYWKMGYASEASQKCKNYGFENDLTDSLISVVEVRNIGSEMVALKNGMKLEKHLQDYDGMDVNIFGITREEWLAQKND